MFSARRLKSDEALRIGLINRVVDAEELEADWSKVRTGFGDQKGAHVDPLFGIHLTGGSNSIKNSYQQYRELGARTKAMLAKLDEAFARAGRKRGPRPL